MVPNYNTPALYKRTGRLVWVLGPDIRKGHILCQFQDNKECMWLEVSELDYDIDFTVSPDGP